MEALALPKGTQKVRRAPSVPALGLVSLYVVPSSGLSPQGQPTDRPTQGRAAARRDVGDLSSCGLTKESRSWSSRKHMPMRKLGPKTASRARRKEGSRGPGRSPSSSSSSVDTVFPGAALPLSLVQGRKNSG